MSRLGRRDLMLGASATALTAVFSPRCLFGLDIGSWFSNLPTAVGAAAVGLFPGAAVALGGFETIKVLGKASNLEDSVGDLISQTKALESHMDSVLTQVSATLTTVQHFVEDCDQALHDIEGLIQQLPQALAAAFSQVAARQAFGRLRGDCMNMAAMLNSKGSVKVNLGQIETLSRQIVKDINEVDALAPNLIQSAIQMAPALSIWLQGYAAYNLFRSQDQRETNPWDHQVVQQLALPKFIALFQAIKQQNSAGDDAGSKLTLDPGTLYTFDGSGFVKSATAFASNFNVGQIDGGEYYTIWPASVAYQEPPLPPGVFRPIVPGAPPPPPSVTTGDLCYLMDASQGKRYWMLAQGPVPGSLPAVNLPPSSYSQQSVAVAYPRLMASAIKNLVAFSQVTSGWELFESSVYSQLRDNSSKNTWTKLPTLSV